LNLELKNLELPNLDPEPNLNTNREAKNPEA